MGIRAHRGGTNRSWGFIYTLSRGLELSMLPSLHSYCSLQDRLVSPVVGARNRGFIQKARKLRRWWISVPKNLLTEVRIQVSFILRVEGVWLVATNFLAWKSFVLAAVYIGQITIFL